MDPPIVTIQGLSKRYGDFPAVTDLSLEVPRGEVFALLGPNGAGKTTTIRMLMGILQPSRGRATIKAMDCSTRRAEIMRYVGYLPDEPVFYDYLRGREIVHFTGEMHGLGPQRTDGAAAALLQRLGLADATEEYAVNYSRGMKKKLAAVCALLHEPELLILDEPTNGLDPFATRTMHQIIREQVSHGRSVFLSTHLLDQAEKLCDRVGILYRGRLAATGRLEELRARASENTTLEEIFFSVTTNAAAEAGSDEPP